MAVDPRRDRRAAGWLRSAGDQRLQHGAPRCRRARHGMTGRGGPNATIVNTCASARPICSWPSSRSAAGARWRSPMRSGSAPRPATHAKRGDQFSELLQREWGSRRAALRVGPTTRAQKAAKSPIRLRSPGLRARTEANRERHASVLPLSIPAGIQARMREMSSRTLASSSFSSRRYFTKSPILTRPFSSPSSITGR